MIVSCPACGGGNPPWAKRCAKCGALLGEQKRQVFGTPDDDATADHRTVAPRHGQASPPAARIPTGADGRQPTPPSGARNPPPRQAPAPGTQEPFRERALPPGSAAALAELLARRRPADDPLSRLSPPEEAEPRLPEHFDEEDWLDEPALTRATVDAEPKRSPTPAMPSPAERPPGLRHRNERPARPTLRSAAIEIPVTPRRRGWLAALAIVLVLAAGVGAFLAVWMTAPERPVAGIDVGEIADRVRDRLAGWGWLAR